MPILVINQTIDKTFNFVVKNKKFELLPGSKNIIELEACPLELTRARSKGEIHVTNVSLADVEFFKQLSQNTVKNKIAESSLEEEVTETNKSVKSKKTDSAVEDKS